MADNDRAGAGITILIAEDDPTARNILSLILPKRFPGIKQLLAENGREGLELFRQHKPEIVVTDIAMPIMDGFAMAGAILSRDPETFIIGISAHRDEEYRRRAAEVGIGVHVEKPVDLKRLFEEIEGCVASVLRQREGVS